MNAFSRPRPGACCISRLFTGVLLLVCAYGMSPVPYTYGTPSTNGPVAEGARAELTNISFSARSDGQGYVVRVQASQKIAAYGMPRSVGENELKWTLYNTALASSFHHDAPEGPIQRFSTDQQDGHVILHFHLDRDVEPDAYRDRASNDVLLNLAFPGGTDAPRPVPTPVAESRPSDGSAAESSPPTRTASSSSSGGSSSNATAASMLGGASQQARERWRLDKVVIDAGHGGKDPGASANGIREKDIVLKVSKQLGRYLEENLGIDVVYTRTDDTFIELEERGKIANRAGAKLFISIHINAARSRSARGTETFFLGQHKTEAARKVMERENSVIRFEENTEKYEDYDEQALVRQVLAQSAYMRQSEKLASLIESQFEDRVNRRSRGVHQAGFYVLWSASMPAVLVELGFLTNPTEARFLKSERGQTYLASAIFRAIRDYKQMYEKGITRTSR
ncbi:N-acetylmuramoyl-L-alanine amidase family protein [Longibacter sp.]|uniref:N-acetylmuramoyl-L-alanine amidase family protein n=1 Tax=Longibacter sp. TaxID=2045415 RepID=UPI003EB8236B